MPHSMDKSAAARAKSFNHFRDIIGRGARQAGSKLKGGSAEETARNIFFGRHGTSSLTGDLGKWVGNKLSGKYRMGDRAGRRFSDFQRKLTDADIRAGNWAHDKINPQGRDGILRNMFMQKQQVPLEPSSGGVANRIMEVDVPNITAPFSKTRDKALPLAGSMYLTSKLYGDDDSDSNVKGGEETMKLSNDYRDYLMEKISEKLHLSQDQPAEKNGNEEDKVVFLIKKASAALQFSAKRQRELERDNIKLAEENQRIRDEYEKARRRQEAEKVASVMSAKGALRKQDIPVKTEELLDLDDNSFELFKEAVENLPLGEKNASDNVDSVDSLTFLSSDSTINERKSTMADSFVES